VKIILHIVPHLLLIYISVLQSWRTVGRLMQMFDRGSPSLSSVFRSSTPRSDNLSSLNARKQTSKADHANWQSSGQTTMSLFFQTFVLKTANFLCEPLYWLFQNIIFRYWRMHEMYILRCLDAGASTPCKRWSACSIWKIEGEVKSQNLGGEAIILILFISQDSSYTDVG